MREILISIRPRKAPIKGTQHLFGHGIYRRNCGKLPMDFLPIHSKNDMAQLIHQYGAYQIPLTSWQSIKPFMRPWVSFMHTWRLHLLSKRPGQLQQ